MTSPAHGDARTTAAARLRSAFPHGLVRDVDGPVAVWTTVARSASSGRVVGIGRTPDGFPTAFDAVLPHGDIAELRPDGGGPWASHGHRVTPGRFGHVLRSLLELARSGRRSETASSLAVTLVGSSSDLRLDAGVVAEVVGLVVEGMVADVGAFLATLDGDAVAEVARTGRWSVEGVSWEGVDRTFGGGSPLRAARSSHPQLALALGMAWRTGRWSDADAADPVGIVSRHVRAVEDHAGWVVDALPEASAAFATLSGPEVEAMRARSVDLLGDEDMVLERMRCLGDLPRDWLPRGHPEWRAWFAMADAVRLAAGELAEGVPLAALVASRGRWVQWSSAIARTVGVDDPGDAAHAVRGLWDVASALSAQVLDPALARSRGSPDDHATDRVADEESTHVAFSVLFSGRSLRRCLELSRIWHGRRARVDAALEASWDRAAMGDADRDGWPAGFPDHVADGFAVRILRTERALLDEGAGGTDAEGQPGLSHCVGGRAGSCRAGRERVASIRARSPDGTWARTSTASFAWTDGTVRVTEHRGRGNVAPTAAAVAFLDGYVGLVRSGALPVDAAALRPLPEVRTLRARAGYPWHAPGAWDAVMALWAPVLPRRLRGATMAEVAALTDGSGYGSGVGWTAEPWAPRGGEAGP